MVTRAGTLLFAVMAAMLSIAALVDVVMNGRLTILDPGLLGGIAVIGIGFLLFGVVSSRDRATDLEGRTDRLTALTEELETFIRALEAANQRLHASEARYKGLVDSQGDAILRRTPDGRLTYANESFFRLFGSKPSDAIGQLFRPEPHPDSAPLAFGKLAGRETGRERVSYDQHVKTIAGYRWIAWEDYAIRDTDGRLIEIQSVGRDITERKRLEAALTEARDKAQDANRAKSHFLATMSYEIRTPMNGVLGMARLLLETSLMPDQKTYAEAITQSGMALLALIEDLLDFSKIESGSMALGREPVHLRALIESVTELLAPRTQAKSIELTAAVAADVPETIETDAVRLRQILTNLVGNAVKFTEEGGVLVSAALEQGIGGALQLRLSVRDTGIGVPEAKRAEIFEEFVQADSSHARRFGGTGLGLAISKRLIGAMGGTIGVNSANERGSIFWVTLPLAGLAPSDAPPLSPASNMLHRKRVALVSASSLLRSGLKMQVAAAGGEFIEAPSMEALRRLDMAFDVMVFDAGVDGRTPLPTVSDLGAPALALLPPHQRAELSQLAAKGFHGYLMKPVRQSSLEQRLAAALLGDRSIGSMPAPAKREPKESAAAARQRAAAEQKLPDMPKLERAAPERPAKERATSERAPERKFSDRPPVDRKPLDRPPAARTRATEPMSTRSRETEPMPERETEPMPARQTEPAPSPSVAAPVVAGPARAAPGLKILLAEDNPVNALLARELLRRRGHTVTEVTTGDGAIAACAKDRFDLVVMDVHMPGLDGIEATRRIRAAEAANHTPHTPILALTADALDAGRRACLEAGMDGVLTKPLDPDQLDDQLASLTAARVAAE